MPVARMLTIRIEGVSMRVAYRLCSRRAQQCGTSNSGADEIGDALPVCGPATL